MSERARRAHLGARPDRLDGRGRGAVARLARRAAAACATTSTCCSSSPRRVVDRIDAVVLLGMGGSSLAPEVLRRTFGRETFHVLDTTHPQAIRDLEAQIDISAHALHLGVQVGLDARDALAHRLLLGADRAATASSSPRSPIRAPSSSRLARERGFAAVFAGEPTIGGRYSALSPFGMVPAALMGVDSRGCSTARSRWPRPAAWPRATRASSSASRSARAGARAATRSASTRARAASASGPSSCSPSRPASTARASSRRRASPPTGPDRQAQEVRLTGDPYELGQEFFRWEFATAVAGSILGINPFDQPDVQAAKDKHERGARARGRRRTSSRDGSADELFAQAQRGRLRLHPGVRQPDAGERGEGARARGAGARPRRAASSRTASGRATCTRRASCTRAGRRRGSSCRSSTTRATSSRSPASRSGSAS